MYIQKNIYSYLLTDVVYEQLSIKNNQGLAVPKIYFVKQCNAGDLILVRICFPEELLRENKISKELDKSEVYEEGTKRNKSQKRS